MRVGNLLVALIPVAVAAGQVSVFSGRGIASVAPAGKPGAVEGIVSNAVTGGPVKKASLVLRSFRQGVGYTAESDLSGRFHFDSVQPDNYSLNVDCPGYTVVTPGMQTISVGDEQHVRDVSVKLSPLGVITGKVLDENGDPLPSARIQAYRYMYQINGVQLNAVRSTSTDDRGQYRLFDLQPAKYYIQASMRDGNLAMVVAQSNLAARSRFHTDLAEEAYPVTYFPGVPDISAATPTDVKPGSEIPGLDFRLHKVRVFHVRGVAIDEQTHQPVHGASVQLQQCVPGTPFTYYSSGAQIQPDGSFDFAGVEPGSYCLLIQSFQGKQSGLARQAINVSDHDPEPVTLMMRSSVQLRGSVVLDGTLPQNFRLSRITITPIDGIGPTPNAAFQPDNSFVLENVLPAAYELQSLGLPPNVYLKSARLGDQDVTGGLLNVTSSSNLTLVLATDTAQLDVTVQKPDGSPALGSVVLAFPADGGEHRQDLSYIGYPQPNGPARVSNMAPGRYRVLAIANGPDLGLIRSHEMLKVLETFGTTVDLSPNAHDTVTAQQIPAEKIDEAKSKLR